MSNKTYDRLKLCGLLIVPIVTFISTILKIWNIPYLEQITATLVAIQVLIGAAVTIASKIYNDNNKEK